MRGDSTPVKSRRVRVCKLGGVVAAALLVASVSAGAEGQQPASDPAPWSAALRVGFSNPKGDLADLADDGLLLGASLDRRVGDRLRIGAEATVENLNRGGRPGFLGGSLGPDIELWRVLAVGAWELTDPGASPWEVAVHAGAGGTWVDASASEELAPYEDLDPTATTGLSLGYGLGTDVAVFARFDGYLFVADLFGDEGPGYLSKEVTLTHTGGVRIRF